MRAIRAATHPGVAWGNLFGVPWARRWGGVILAAALAAGLAAAAPAPVPASASAPAAGLDVSAIRSEQAAVVTQRHQQAIDLAQLAVAETGQSVANDQAALAGDRRAAAYAEGTRQAARSKLGSDQSALAVAVVQQQAAHARLAADRNRLRSIATALYTGEITNPQPASVQQLEANQQAVIDTGELEVVAGVVVKTFHVDVATSALRDRRRADLTAAVDRDMNTVQTASSAAAGAEATAQRASVQLVADEQRAATAAGELSAAQAALRGDLTAVAGPASTGLTVMGAPALDATQLVDWYQSNGYVDLTPAPVDQLAAWYVQDGEREGVRGDLAFAQAVLETGGFSSPDSVNLNNYAGIGHCDTCAAGWQFPSPQGGVDGQLQLLRIFAGGIAPQPIAPVVAALAPGKQSRSGCCSTWESLTGVWATDPTYGAQILGIYNAMLQFASSSGVPA